jgi:hypothetical protein
MPIQFPSNATTGQTHQTGGQTWVYDGTAWTPILSGATGATGPSANVAVYDEGNLVVNSLTAINFVGPAISANLVNGNVDVTVTATGTGSGGFSYANTAPVTAEPGDRWLHSDTLRELVYIDDGTSSQWIEPIAIGLTGATGPQGLGTNIAVYDETTLITSSANSLKFIGAGIAANLVTGNIEVTVSATGSGQFTFSNTAPVAPVVGSRWLDSDSGKEFIYVTTGNTSIWMEPVSSSDPGVNLSAVAGNILPAGNLIYDLGSDTQRWRDLYLSGNSIRLGGATLSSTGSAVNLPAGSTVGGQNVATSGDVSTGGGPKITNLEITSNVAVVLDDTAVDLTGGYIRLTGTNFVTGCLVYAGTQPATSTTFISATEVRAQLGAQAAGTYPVYLVNPDGGTAIRVPGVTYSASPAWQTASSLGDQYDGVLLNLSVIATDAVTYTLVSGSLPPGLSLNSNTGVISGTISGVVNDTVYTFTINAVDAQLQDSPRVFTINVTVSDPYFKLTTLLLTGNSGNTVVTDSSVNNFAITVVGDSRASNFSPYLTGWSNYFDGTGDYLSFSAAVVQPSTSDFTIEGWLNMSGAVGTRRDFLYQAGLTDGSLEGRLIFNVSATGTIIAFLGGTNAPGAITSSTVVSPGVWYHFAYVRNANTFSFYINGVREGTQPTGTIAVCNQPLLIGTNTTQSPQTYWHGYLTNIRIINGTALYTSNFTPATTTLTSVAGTSLLTCHANRFVDSSTNNFAITRNGDVRVTSFNPFNLTNTGTTGSVYFDGTGDYCFFTDSSNALDLGGSQASFECWVYPISTTNYQILFKYGGTGDWNTTNGIEYGLSLQSGVVYFYYNSSASALNINSGTTTVPANTWTHIVVASNASNALSLYVNGTRVASTTAAITKPTTRTSVRIGVDASNYANGYMSNYRFITGSNAYDPTLTTVTIPTTPVTAIANTQLLTLQNRQPPNNHTFQDSSANNFLITRSGNATQGTFSPFSQTGWSVYFNGYGLESSGLTAIGATDFSMEVFIYPTAYTYSCGIVGLHTNASAYGPSIYLSTTGAIITGIRNGPGAIGLYTGPDNQAPLNQWTFIAFTRSGGLLKTFVNGVEVNSVSNSTDCTSTLLSIGEQYQDYSPSGRTYTGYISNIRIVRGSNGYAGSVPTSPLSKIANTHLLCCNSYRWNWDQSDNNYSLVGDSGTPSVQAFSPFAATATYSAVTHGGSAYFDGSGDYLTVADSPAFNFGSDNFTVECWVYPTTSSIGSIFSKRINNATYAPFSIGATALAPAIYASTNGSTWGIGLVSSISFTQNSWNHFAVTRNGSTFTLWVNGNSGGTSTGIGTSALMTNSTAVSIAATAIDGNSPLVGYISNFRVIKGTSVYTANFTPPTAPVTATTNTSLLLDFTNDAIEDATSRNVIETVGDARTTSVVTKWAGSHSMYFDGTGDYLAVPANVLHNQLYASTKSFTIEFWIYLLAYAGAGVAATIISTYGGGGGADGWRIETSPNSPATNIRWVSNGADTSCNATIELNTWIHYAFTYNGTTVKVFKNGTLGNTATTSWTNNSGRMFIGTANAGLNFPLTAYMADIRITNAERYTANFTPPTGPARLK